MLSIIIEWLPIFFLVLAVIASVGPVLLQNGKEKTLKQYKRESLISCTVALVFYMCFVGSIALHPQLEEWRMLTEGSEPTTSESIEELVSVEYGLSIMSDLDPITHQANNGTLKERPSDPIYATFAGDERIYIIYLVQNDDGELKAYTKNEKGVFLPVTKMMNNGKDA